MMTDILIGLYPWTKALHIIAVVSWMAALLYLPRLFVYHADKEAGSEASEMLKIMEYRLFRYIMSPAMSVSFGLGLILLLTPGIVDWSAGWIYVKLIALVGMFGIHGMLSKWRKAFAVDANKKSARFFRVANEVPTVLMILIVIMVVVKPF